jgi:hypothetical protein
MSSASPVSNIDAAEILAAIGKLETDLAKMKVALGATGVVVPKARKSAKAPAADGEKKAPNAWIVFTQKVDGALKAASIATGAATVGKQFASSLKDIKPYAEWTNEAIVAAWPTWEKPAPKPKASASSASESEEGGGAPAAPKKERKKRAPMTAEQKAAAKVKRDAKKAAAAGGGGAPASASEDEDDDASVAPEPASSPPVPPAEPPAKAFAKKVVGAAKPAFSLEQLADFTPKDIEGAEYGVNCRGDVVDGDGNYLGQWNSKTKVLSRSGSAPADWQTILDAMNA